MKHLEDLTQIMIKLGIVKDKQEMLGLFTTDGQMEVIDIAVLRSIDHAIARIKERVYADLNEIHLVASGYEEDTSDLD